MSKYYIDKNKKGIIKTTKTTLIANIDKLDGDYEYKKGLSKKTPKELIIRGKQHDDFTYYTNLIKIPIKKVIIDCNIHSHNQSLKGFFNTKELEITNNAKRIEIYNNYGLINIKNLTIPFNINMFDNNYILNNKINTITIKYQDREEIIELDDVFFNERIDMSISNTNNILNIYIESKYSKVNYKVYIENNEIKYDKNYIKYEILPSDDKVLDLIELRRIYNCEFTSNKVLTNETIIISKKDYSFLKNAFFKTDKLMSIIIKDDNEMSLLPRTININFDKDRLKNVEIYNNKLMLNLETEDENDKFILINEDLSYIKFARDYLLSIKKVYIDFNTTKFSLTKLDGEYSISIPVNTNYNTKNSEIITNIIWCANEIYVRTEEGEIPILRCEPGYNGKICSIDRSDSKDFCIQYYEYVNGIPVCKQDNYILYRYDKNNKTYIDSYNDYVNYSEYKKVKKLIKK